MALAGMPLAHGKSTGESLIKQSSGKQSMGVKSLCAMNSGRLCLRMWLDTAHKLR